MPTQEQIEQAILLLGGQVKKGLIKWQDAAVEFSDFAGEQVNAEALRGKYRRLVAGQKPVAKRPARSSILNVDDISTERSDEHEIGKYLDTVEAQQPVLARQESIYDCPTISIEDKNWIGVVYGGDWHLGNKTTMYKAIRAEVDCIANTPGLYFAFQGDIIEGAIPGGSPDGLKNEMIIPVDMQRKIAEHFCEKLSGKLILAITGCHDWWTVNAADYHFVREAAKIAGCVYLGGGGTYVLQFANGLRIEGYASHKPRGYSQWNPLHPCVKEASLYHQNAQVVTIAHQHVIATGAWIVSDKWRMFARTSARKVWDRWGSKLGDDGKRPKWIGVPVLIFNPQTGIGTWLEDVFTASKLLTQLRKGVSS